MTELTVPGTVKTIGELAFYWSLQLKKVSICSGVTSIGRKAFSECFALSDIVVPVSVTTLGEAVFDRSLKLTDIYCEAASKPSAWNESWMGDCAASVHWGDTWEYIGNIPQMKEPEGSFSEGLSYVSNGNGTTCTLTGMGTCSDTDLVIPKTHNGMTVTAIGDWAFEISSCYTELGAVELSNSITTIGMGAFDHQTFLRKVTLSENLTDIESNAIAYTGLSKIVIPESVTFIGANAFLGCSDLKNIYLESETVPDSWDAAWLGNCSAAIHLGNEWEYVNGVPTLK